MSSASSQTFTNRSELPKLYSERFDMIDAFRGLAALAVVVHHVVGGINPLFKLGHPAVMIFFVISGYCIASAADACERKGLTFAQFMWRRLRRIYPPYLLSLGFWAATRVLKWKLGGENDLARPWTDWLQNLTLTQWLTMLRTPVSYPASNHTPFVAVYWSLNYEEQFYLVFGLMMLITAAIGVRVRTMVAILIGASIAWIAIFPRISYGFFIEYWAMFGVGCLVFYRLCRLQATFWRRASEAALVAIFAGSLAMRLIQGDLSSSTTLSDIFEPAVRIAWGDLAISSGFALLLLLLRPLDSAYKSQRWLSVPLGKLGLITYSLYLVHQFNLVLVSTTVDKAFRLVHIANSPLALNLAVQCAMHICIAAVFWYLCERPFLNKSLLPSAPTTSK